MGIRMNLAAKLRVARRAVGISTRKAAESLAPRYRISHATIANYEKGITSPSLELMAALAELYERPLKWFLERGTSLTHIRYRNLPSKVRVADRHRFEGEVHRWLDAYVAIEQHLGKPLRAEIGKLRAKGRETAAELALRVRRELALPVEAPGPILSVVDVLDRFGIRTIEQPTELRIDGLAAKYEDEHVVVLNPAVSNDRCRLNAAHELGHILFGDCDGAAPAETKTTETRAFDFASHFLLPNSRLKEAFTGQSVVRLVQFKERFGISLAAMAYRAEKARLIAKPQAKRLWIEFAKRGWKTDEPGRVRRDRATRFEELLDSAILEGRMSLREAAATAGVRPEEIRRRIDFAMGIDGAREADGEPPIIAFNGH